LKYRHSPIINTERKDTLHHLEDAEDGELVVGGVAIGELLSEVVEDAVVAGQVDELVAGLRVEALPQRRLAIHDEPGRTSGCDAS
jgi:hypothetical protein